MNTINLLADNLINCLNDYISILDTECNFVKVNEKQMSIMGHKSDVEILGKSYHQFKSISTSIAGVFLEQDKSLIKNKMPIRYLSYHKYTDGKWHLLLGDKQLLYSHDQSVIGIFSQAKDVTNDRLIDFSRFMFNEHKTFEGKASKSGFEYIFSNHDDICGLSQKEMVVLFYFLRGKSAREIATIIYRSAKTINAHLESIKSKLNVASKSALIEKAIFKGLINIIPSEIF